MKTVSTRELQHKTRRLREQVAHGETLIWKNRGQVIAYITPVNPPTAQTKAWPDIMARLRQQFGDRVFPDSQPMIDEMREERF